MARVGLDPDGRLISLLVVPGERTEPGSISPEPDWAPLLSATGVDPKTLNPVLPEWAPPVFADRRAAWTGSWPGQPNVPLRIEAAAAGGRPVSLQLVLPWTRPAEEPGPAKGFWQRASALVDTFAFVVVTIVAGFVAWRNVRRGRGDRRGALRLALYLGAARMLWYLDAHHVASPGEVKSFIFLLAFAMLEVGIAYVFYLAIEPYARRLWPRMLVSWVRVLEGRFRDPLVGRDVLIGSVAGALLALIAQLRVLVPQVFGGIPSLPLSDERGFEWLRGTVPAFVTIVEIHSGKIFEIIFPLTFLLLFRLLLRRTGLAWVAVALVGFVLFTPESGGTAAYVVAYSAWMAICWLVLFRAGLLAFAAMFVVSGLLEWLPLIPNPPGWYMGTMLLSLTCIVAPGLWGFWISRAGRPLFGDEILGPATRR
jgi:serine/threonine-protein kinase